MHQQQESTQFPIAMSIPTNFAQLLDTNQYLFPIWSFVTDCIDILKFSAVQQSWRDRLWPYSTVRFSRTRKRKAQLDLVQKKQSEHKRQFPISNNPTSIQHLYISSKTGGIRHFCFSLAFQNAAIERGSNFTQILFQHIKHITSVEFMASTAIFVLKHHYIDQFSILKQVHFTGFELIWDSVRGWEQYRVFDSLLEEIAEKIEKQTDRNWNAYFYKSAPLRDLFPLSDGGFGLNPPMELHWEHPPNHLPCSCNRANLYREARFWAPHIYLHCKKQNSSNGLSLRTDNTCKAMNESVMQYHRDLNQANVETERMRLLLAGKTHQVVPKYADIQIVYD